MISTSNPSNPLWRCGPLFPGLPCSSSILSDRNLGGGSQASTGKKGGQSLLPFFILQGDLLYIPVFSWYLVKSDANVRYCTVANTVLDKSRFTRYQKNTVMYNCSPGTFTLNPDCNFVTCSYLMKRKLCTSQKFYIRSERKSLV